MKKGVIFMTFIISVIVIVTPFSSAYSNGWEWAENAFDVDQVYDEDIKERPYTTVPDLKKSVNRDSPYLNPELTDNYIADANYLLNPKSIHWYRLEEQGFTDAYNIVCSILTASNYDYSMFVLVNADTVAYVYILQGGYPLAVSKMNSGSTAGYRFSFGTLFANKSGGTLSGPLNSRDLTVPQMYVFRYNYEDDTFTNRSSNSMSESVFGFDFNQDWSCPSNYSYNFSLFSYSYSNFIAYQRDYYFFGSYSYNLTSRLTDSFTNKNYNLTSSSSFPYYYCNVQAIKGYQLGNIYNILNSSWASDCTGFLYDSNFTTADFKLQNVASYDETYSSDINSAIIQFTHDTNDLITRVNSMKSRFTNYISTYFTIFSNTNIPSAIYFVILFLVVVALVVGVFT